MGEDGGPYNHNPGEDWDKPVSGDDLDRQEKSLYHPDKNSTEARGTEQSAAKQGLYHTETKGALTKGALAAAASVTPWGRAIKFVSKHKTSAGIFGGGLTTTILLVVVFFGFIAAHELQTIEADIERYEDKGVAEMEKEASKKLLQHMLCAQLSGQSSATAGCKDLPSDNDDEPLGDEVKDFDFTEPKVVEGLANQNIKVETTDDGNKFNGLTDLTTGEPITIDDINNDPALLTRFQTAIPEFDVGIRSTFEPLMIDHAGASFDVVKSPDDEDVDKTDIETSVLDTDPENAAQLGYAQAEDEEKQSANPTPTQEQEAAAATSTAGDENAMIDAAESAIEHGETEPEAIGAAEEADGLDSAAGEAESFAITMAISNACSIDKIATDLAAARVPELIGLLIRHGTTLFSLADEMKNSGTMSGTQITDATNLLNGDPKANPDSNDPNVAQSAEPFDMSAAWQRIEGNPLNTNQSSKYYNPDISPSAMPTANSGTLELDQINYYMALVGIKDLCTVINNPVVGLIFILGGTSLQVYLDGASGLTSQAGFFAFGYTLSEVLQHYVVPDLVKYFTPVGVDGLESSVEWLNNADAGSNLMFNMLAMRIGGQPLTQTQSVALNEKGSQSEQLSQDHESFFDRTFSFSDPSSLVSKLIVDLPLSKFGIIESFFGDFIRAPSLLVHAIGSLIDGGKLYAASQATDPGQPYGVTQYGLNDSQIDAYDPIQNESYLYNTTVTYSGETRSLISLLGNPNQYPNGSDDSSPDDILHCYTQDYIDPSNITASPASRTTPDQYCGSMGSFDYANDPPAPIGTAQVIASFCAQLPPPEPNEPPCPTVMASLPQVQSAISRFQQYLLDDEVMGYYSSLMTNR